MEHCTDGTYRVTCRCVVYRNVKYLQGSSLPKEVSEAVLRVWDLTTINQRVSKRGYIDYDAGIVVGSHTPRDEIWAETPPGIDKETWQAMLAEAEEELENEEKRKKGKKEEGC